MASARPIIVGITGSIGMGKSAIAQQFQRLGFPVQSADDVVHDLYKADGAAVEPVAAFAKRNGGADVKGADGSIDRKRLSECLLQDNAAKRFKELEIIVHPLVADARQAFIAAHSASFLVALDVPLLYETNTHSACDYVVVASTMGDVELQKERVLRRPNMTAAKLDSVLAKQMPDAEKREKADAVIDTRDTALSAMRNQVAAVIDTLAKQHKATFDRKVLGVPQGVEPSKPLVAVALDLDDTIWPTMTWLKALEPKCDELLQRCLPNSFKEGNVRLASLREAMAKASSDYPFLKHDLAATRRKVLMQFAAAHGDSEDQVDQFSEEYEHQRTALAHDCMYTDTIPFLSELKQNGVLIAAITDGTADVMKTKLSDYFDVSVSAESSGTGKPNHAIFVELLTELSKAKGRQVCSHEVLVIGDNYGKDVVGAQNAQMHAGWLRRAPGEQFPCDPALKAGEGVIELSGLDSAQIAGAGLAFTSRL